MVFLCLKLKAVAAYLHVEKIKQIEEDKHSILAP